MATREQHLASLSDEQLQLDIDCAKMQCNSGLTIASPEEDKIAWSETKCGGRILDNPCSGLSVSKNEKIRRNTAGLIDLNSRNGKFMLVGGAVIGLWAISKGLSLIKYLAIGTAGYLAYKEYKKRQLKYG